MVLKSDITLSSWKNKGSRHETAYNNGHYMYIRN